MHGRAAGVSIQHGASELAACRLVQGPAATARVAEAMQALGLSGPVLVVADTTAVSQLAIAWAEAFATAGWTHRVIGFSGMSVGREIAGLVREAESLGAATILGAGGPEALDAAAAVAAATSAAFVATPA